MFGYCCIVIQAAKWRKFLGSKDAKDEDWDTPLADLVPKISGRIKGFDDEEEEDEEDEGGERDDGEEVDGASERAYLEEMARSAAENAATG